MSSCKVCRKTSYRKSMTTFFRFPKNPERCKQWAERCNLLDDFHRRGCEYFYKSYRLCSEHFPSNVIRWNGKKKSLSADAVPEIALDRPRKIKIRATVGLDDQTEKQIDDMLVCDDTDFRLQMVDHLCRLCGEEKPGLTCIFGQHGRSLDLPKKIKFFPVTILKNDIMPSKVCRPCIKKIEDNFSFFTRCLESDEKIRIMLDMEDRETTYEVEGEQPFS